MDRLTALDATFLELEELDEGALMSIGGVMVFDPLPGSGAPAIEDLRASLAARLSAKPIDCYTYRHQYLISSGVFSSSGTSARSSSSPASIP